MAAYKVGAQGGDRDSQWHVGIVYHNGQGVDVDYKQALPWIEKAAAQDLPDAVCHLGVMHGNGSGMTPSWRRALEYYERAIKLGHLKAVENMQKTNEYIQMVMSERAKSTPRHLSYACTCTHRWRA